MNRILILFSFCLIFALSQGQELGQRVWGHQDLGKGLTDVTTFSSGKDTYLVCLKGEAGKVYIHRFTEEGWVSNCVDSLKLPFSGNIAFDVFSIPKKPAGRNIRSPKLKTGGRPPRAQNLLSDDYLFVSFADYGYAAIYKLHGNGLLGRKTWETTRWEKGITRLVTLDCHTKQYILLVKPGSGKAWTYELLDDGTAGLQVWQTADWYTRNWSVSACSRRQNGAKVILMNRDGVIRVVNTEEDGIPDQSVFFSENWVKGVEKCEINWVNFRHYILLSQPETGFLQAYEITDGNHEPRLLWQKKQSEKGISILHAFEDFEGREKLFLSNPDKGSAEIYLIQ
jgi:hypothetical protein